MISAVFETERFRVHITGKAAWVEAKQGANWVFCNWHALPVAGDCNDSDALKAAVENYEEARRGDHSLRIALTGLRQELPKVVVKSSPRTAIKPAITATAPAKNQQRFAGSAVRGVSSRAKKSTGYYGFRAPLRPPLLAPAVAVLGPNAPGN